MYCRILKFILTLNVIAILAQANNKNIPNGLRQKINFNHDWQFYRFDSSDVKPSNAVNPGLYDTTRTDFNSQFLNEYIQSAGENASVIIRKELEEAIIHFKKEYPSIENLTWQQVDLPHTAMVEPLVSKELCWEGICYYRKYFTPAKELEGKKLILEFEGAMQQADVWVNGQMVRQQKGGYTPFLIDLTNLISFTKKNEVIVRLDNRPGKDFPIGRESSRNGYTYWSGLYRSVFLHATNQVHITDAVSANEIAGGGIFFRTPKVSGKEATARIKTHVSNESGLNVKVKVKQVLVDKDGKKVADNFSEVKTVLPNSDIHIEQQFTLADPNLWHPDHPNLYRLQTIVFANEKPVDQMEQKVGFRHLSFSRKDGFLLNGEKLHMTGTNRHQDYPYIGVALSKNAQYRDMKKIKDDGFNAVRLAHYPHDVAVYEAADELGIMLLDCIPGWQFFNKNDIFIQRSFQNIRDMIHRDRNHPSVILWEVSMNECYPPEDFRNKSQQIAREELPEGEYFTTGETYGAKHTTWDVAINNWYDPVDSIFRNTTERVQDIQPEAAGLIKEYADWEFGAWNSTTRSTRARGEDAMLQGVWNILWEHNANLKNYPYTVGDFTWAMFDNYISGDHKMYEWGTRDIFRLPKFTGYFFRSQNNPERYSGTGKSVPVVYIANWWTSRVSPSKVVVFSNCDRIVLSVNGKVVGDQKPDSGPDTFYGFPDKGGNTFDGGNCSMLKHPAFTFKNIVFEPGTLKAEGYIRNQKVADKVVVTPGKPICLKIEADLDGIPLAADGADAVFIHASLIDKNGTISCLDNSSEITFSVSGVAKITGPSVVAVRGGIATILLQSNSLKAGEIKIKAHCSGLPENELIIKSK